MDTPETPATPATPQDPAIPAAADAPSTRSRARRAGRYAAIAGVSALALIGAGTVGAMVVAGPRMEAVRDVRIGMGDGSVHAGATMQRGPAAMRAQAIHDRGSRGMAGSRVMGDPAARMAEREEQRAARVAELATALDLDVAELTEAVDALHVELDAERAALRAELADATPMERREAMLGLREDRQARMRDLLVGLGADADAVDALLAEHAAEHAGSHAGRFRRAGAMLGRSL